MGKFGRFLKKVHSRDSEYSSKRIYGGIGFCSYLVCMFFAVFSNHAEMPESIDTLLIVCASLLGVDSVVSAWGSKTGSTKNKNNSNNDDYNQPYQGNYGGYGQVYNQRDINQINTEGRD